MKKRIAISQSNYIPWKGYFDMINSVDEFVLYDDVQYTKGDWRNRNFIKTPQGLKWLSIPVSASTSININEVLIADASWNSKHWKIIRHVYTKAPGFAFYSKAINQLYEEARQEKLSDINRHFLEGICDLLEITTPITWSTDYKSGGDKSQRLLDICMQANANVYVSGPAAKVYLDTELFSRHRIAVEWMDYQGYPEYPQLCGEFNHNVSIIDLLFSVGNKAVEYLKSTRLQLQ